MEKDLDTMRFAFIRVLIPALNVYEKRKNLSEHADITKRVSCEFFKTLDSAESRLKTKPRYIAKKTSNGANMSTMLRRSDRIAAKYTYSVRSVGI